MIVYRAVGRRLRFLLLVTVGMSWLGAHAGTRVIDQRGQDFSEKSVSLSAGDELTFANHDEVAHNISIIDDDDDNDNLGLQKPGMTLSHIFDKRGRFKVRCSIHPNMRMTVMVK